MLAYARSDTHYLLYIYDQLRRDLHSRSEDVKRDLLHDVLDSSRKMALIAYRREGYDFATGSGTDGWNKLLQNGKGPKLHSTLQLTVFKRVHRWRDQIAREEDESTQYVLPNRSLMNIAATLPLSMQGVIGACYPVPPLVQVYAEDIAYIVQKTRKELEEEVAKAETLAAEVVTGTKSLTNGVTGSKHLWYTDLELIPEGVRSAVEAVKHGAQFDIWGNQHDRIHELLLPSSDFWEPLHREHETVTMYQVGRELEDIKLSVPLPPLTAQIYLTPDDLNVEEYKGDNVASLAQHPFVQRTKPNLQVSDESDVIIARKLKKKTPKRERDEIGENEYPNGDEDDTLIRTKHKPKRRKGLKQKFEVTNSATVEQFDPYKTNEEKSSSKVLRGRGAGEGKSMTFVPKQ
jgi:HRDC domain